MENCKPNKVGLVFGATAGGFHLLWAVLIFLWPAQPLINFILLIKFILWAQMINPFFVVRAFDISAVINLIVVTSLIGYIVGYIVGVIWNKVHKG